jgi:hypothetical protein
MDRLGLILQMRGADTVLADCRFRFWNVWIRWRMACRGRS